MAELKALNALKKTQEQALQQTIKLIEMVEGSNSETTEKKVPKEKKEKKVKEPKPETETKEKNLKKMSPTISKSLQKLFEDANVEWDDKYKKEFAEDVNSLSSEDYKTQTLEQHMNVFLKSKTPPNPASVGGGGSVQAPPEKKLPDVLTLKQLKELKGLVETDEPGVFRTKQGKLVTGPLEIDDEEDDQGTFEGMDVTIGEITKRVYNSDSDFIGFWGLGKFKDADM